MRRTIPLTVVVLVLVAMLGVPNAGAVWGGEPDTAHRMVGAMYADYFPEDGRITWEEQFCSGSYAGLAKDGRSKVFLTAAHCLAWVSSLGSGTVYVSFDPDPQEGDGIPEDLVASSAFAWDQRFIGHEGVGGYRYDSGVVLLPRNTSTKFDAVVLPPLRYLDDLNAAGALKGTLFELVGYGIVPLCWATDGSPTPCAPPAWSYVVDGLRRTGEAPAKTLTEEFLWLNQNIDATGYGGLCYGDSGSPQFVLGTTMVVSTASDFDTACRASSFNYRLDTPEAREFLGRYLALP
jgi:hypothetical protein